MVRIRLRRVGAKKQPHYRVVVTDSHSPREGKFLEIIGTYNPRTEPPAIEIDAERAVYWLNLGAQPTEAVKQMFDKRGIIAHAEIAKRSTTGEVRAPKPEPIAELPLEAADEVEEFADLDMEEADYVDEDEFEDEEDEDEDDD